jgi:hypothetical protein
MELVSIEYSNGEDFTTESTYVFYKSGNYGYR